jgi:hypothetical protein
VSAARLFYICKTLNVPLSSMFEATRELDQSPYIGGGAPVSGLASGCARAMRSSRTYPHA